METLAIYNFKILYIKGNENTRADILSRKPEYLENKIYELYTIFKQEGDSLIFNSVQLATITSLCDNYLKKQV
jgi:hypothetical protein